MSIKIQIQLWERYRRQATDERRQSSGVAVLQYWQWEDVHAVQRCGRVVHLLLLTPGPASRNAQRISTAWPERLR